MFSRLLVLSLPHRRVCVALGTATVLAGGSSAWSLSKQRVGAEVLYEKPSESIFSSAGRTAVCFVDGKNEAKIALLEAIRSKKAEDKLIVIHFVDSEAPPFFDFATSVVSSGEETASMKQQIYEEAKEMTLQYKSILEANKVTNVELILMPCVRPQSRAVRFVNDVNAEIVYVGTHNFGSIARTILGSFSHYVLHNTKGCVVVAREKPHGDTARKERVSLSDQDGISQALQSVVVRDVSSPRLYGSSVGAKWGMNNAWNENMKRGKISSPQSRMDEEDNNEENDIDGFILVGPPSLS